MATFQRDIYNTTAGTVGFSGAGNRVVTFTGMANAIGTLDAAGSLVSPFGAGSLLRVGDRLGVVATVDSTSQVTLAHDWAGSAAPGQAYQLYTGVVSEAVMAGIYQTAGLKGTAGVPFQELVWDDGTRRMRFIAEGGQIKCYVGLTRPDSGPETATNLAYAIDPATGAVTASGTVSKSGGTMTGALNWAAAVNVASAAVTDIWAAASNVVNITGMATITSFGTIAAGAMRWVRFSGALTLTHNAVSLILPGASNITTDVGACALVESLGSGNARVHYYAAATAAGARARMGAAASGANTDITSLGGLTSPLSIAQGGTGATTAAGATAALNAMVGDGGTGGTKGLVPAPAAGDAAAGKVLGAGGGWVTPAVAPTGRPLLTGNRTYYVRTDGSDSNNGLTNSAGGAFLTIQKAWDVIVSLDLGGFTATIKLGNTGAFTAGLWATVGPVGGNIIIEGDTTTPTNTVISTTNSTCLSIYCPVNLIVRYLKLQTTTAGNGIVCDHAAANISTTVVHCGAIANYGFYSNRGTISIAGGYTISGGGNIHYAAAGGGKITVQAQTITVSGTPAFSPAFAYAAENSAIVCGNLVYSGAATGTRYSISFNAIIQTFGQSTSLFPGSVAGSIATGGQYG